MGLEGGYEKKTDLEEESFIIEEDVLYVVKKSGKGEERYEGVRLEIIEGFVQD